MLWVYFTILSAIAWSITNIIDKYTLDKYVRNPMIGTIFMGCIGLIAAFITSQIIEFLIPTTDLIILLLMGGITYTAAVVFYFKAIVIDEVSRVTSLFSLTPIFVLILATIFLGEIFTVQKYVGIILIVVGSFIISIKRGDKLELSKSLSLMVLSTIFFSLNNIVSKYALGSLDYWNVFIWMRIGAFLPIPLLLYFYRKQTLEVLTQKPKGGIYLGIAEIMNIIGVILFTIALSYGFVSLVAALGKIQNFIVLIFATLISVFIPRIIKEELKGSTISQKFIAISLMVAGSILII